MPRSMPLTYVRCSPASKAKSSWDHSCSFLILFTLRPTYLRISIRKASPDDDYWSTDYEDMMATKTRKKAEQRYKVGKMEPRSVDVYVGHHLRERRTIVGISRTALGETVGLSFQQIQKFEKGMNRMGASRLYELSVRYPFIQNRHTVGQSSALVLFRMSVIGRLKCINPCHNVIKAVAWSTANHDRGDGARRNPRLDQSGRRLTGYSGCWHKQRKGSHQVYDCPFTGLYSTILTL
jgi:DNA-binding XRE family transcriptional regulator